RFARMGTTSPSMEPRASAIGTWKDSARNAALLTRLGLAQLAQATVADQLALAFVPQPQVHGLEAFPQRQRLDLLEQRVVLVAFLQVVIRDARRQVVDVVEADVAAEPLQDRRQLVEAAAAQRR